MNHETRGHHETIGAEAAGALVLVFTLFLRPVAGAILGAVARTINRKDK